MIKSAKNYLVIRSTLNDMQKMSMKMKSICEKMSSETNNIKIITMPLVIHQLRLK